MSVIKRLIDSISELNKKEENFISEKEISNQIKFLFPNLNESDADFLLILTIYLINFISKKFYFEPTTEYKDQWTQNGFRNVKSAILKLLPFIDDKDNFRLFKKIYDLNQILISTKNIKNLPKDLNTISMDEAIKNYFNVSNFTIGLLGGDLSKLKFIDDNGDKLIYSIIHHNFISLLESIKLSSNKLYINWINIIPISIDNIYESKIYKYTIDNLKKIEEVSDINSYYDQLTESYNGIPIDDIYNTFRNGYFESIRNIKWLIFNKIPLEQSSIESDTNPIGKYYIQILEENFSISQYLEVFNYNDLSDDQKLDFDRNLKKLIFNSNKKFEYIELIKSLIIFLVNNYKYRIQLDKYLLNEYSLKPNDEFEINDLDFNKKILRKIDEKPIPKIIEELQLIDNLHIYNYIVDSINLFKSTIYSTFLFKDNKINTEFFYIKLKNEIGEEVNTNINVKNLYNIAKTLSFNNSDNKWIMQKQFFSSINFESKIHFLYKFLEEDLNIWLNISKNIDTQLQNNSSLNKNTLLDNIQTGWNEFKFYFVFYYLSNKGLLSKFVPNTLITDDKILPSNYKAKSKVIGEGVKKIINDNKLEDSYYYLTNKKYKDLGSYYEKDKDKITYKNYTEKLEKDLNWYTFYAMDWMAQISFFHSYINHQILFITGSTGTGKSTQVPKLLLYALKAIDYRENGKISCTQPRIPPTVGNAERISEELGVPIRIFDNEINEDIKSENYNIQYKHSEDQHTSMKSDLQLKITTDGTLLEELVDNIYMKEKKYDKKKENFEIKQNNIYDIIIVDEAHEHGKNMDLILTLARNTCYFNNQVRLVIISATMEDDEPNYRSYYKFINDNFLFPIKFPLPKHPFLDIFDFLPQTIFQDRRFHISKPGETTQFKIDENVEYAFINEDEVNDPWKIIQKNSYEVALKIFNSNPDGNALLFCNGQKEIIETIKILNSKLPGDVVALPFFGKMDQKYKDIISKIDKKINLIKNRYTIHETWGENYIESKGSGNFKRAVIVATNVAEASVTIPKLKFVIDNGYSKVNEFDYNFGESRLIEQKISNSSRIQRKGRVGRISDGSIYYLYDPKSRESIKTRYEISNSDFSNDFIKLSRHKSEDLCLDPNINPHIDRQDNDVDESESDSMDNQQSLILFNSLKKIIQKQYYQEIQDEERTLDESSLFYFNKIYPKEFFKETNFPWVTTQLTDGFNNEILEDKHGMFFIVHPFEKGYKRNVFRKFIERDEVKLKKKEVNIHPMFKSLLKVNFRIAITELSTNSSDFAVSNSLRKTYLSKKIEEISRDFPELSYSFSLILLSASASGLLEEVILLFSMLESIDYNIPNLFKNPIDSRSYLTNKSDLEPLLKICENFKSQFSLKKIFYYEREKNRLKNKYDLITMFFNNSSVYKNKDLGGYNFSKKKYLFFNSLKKQGKLNSDRGFNEWLLKDSYNRKFFKSDFKKDEIMEFCNNYSFNEHSIDKFIDNIIEFKIKISAINFKEDPMYDVESPFTWALNFTNNFNSSFVSMNKYDKIINLFLIGNSQNVCLKKNINLSEYYRITHYGSPIYGENKMNLNAYQLNVVPKIHPILKTNNRFLDNNSSLIFYLKSGIGSIGHEIRIISNINEENLIISNPFYFNPNVIRSYVSILYDEEKYRKIFSNDNVIFRDFLNNLNNQFSITKIIWNNKKIIPFLTKNVELLKKIEE